MKTKISRVPKEFEDIIDIKLNEYLDFKGMQDLKGQSGLKSWFISNKITPHIRAISFTNCVDDKKTDRKLYRRHKVVARY